MADINIEKFYQHIGKILSILYAEFPSKTPLYVDDVAGIDTPDKYGLHSPTYTAGFFAMIWLAEEDFLRYSDTIHQDGIDQACLTSKAFLRLTAPADPIYVEPEGDQKVVSLHGGDRTESLPPSVIEERSLVINQLRSALRARSSIALTKVVSHILAN
ncbi:MAG: hypothetical protein CMQ24_21890 [Gammaproteobacteria bacterium]|nr:hypothetical protein [Gammaproteobacteria bacterium]